MQTMKTLDRSRRSGRLTLTEQLLESLGQAVVAGEFDGRSFPTEAEISQHYGTSRSVTREAVKMLTAKGMLAARPRSGITTQPQEQWSLLDPDVLRWMLERKFSYELLRHFTEMRLGLEPSAAALAAKNATPESLRNIELGLDRMAAAERGDGDHLAADISFHVAILSATGNPFYMQLDELITTALKISIRMTNRIKGHTASIPAHRRVFDAIRAGDAVRADAAMTSILSEVMTLVAAGDKTEPRRSKRSRP
jgi:DNA-binding FadR family transcriptional regulator